MQVESEKRCFVFWSLASVSFTPVGGHSGLVGAFGMQEFHTEEIWNRSPSLCSIGLSICCSECLFGGAVLRPHVLVLFRGLVHSGRSRDVFFPLGDEYFGLEWFGRVRI
jgi:hypothetical protein